MKISLLVVLAALALAEAVSAISAASASAVSTQLREQTDTYVTAYINVTYWDSKGERRSERSETAKFGEYPNDRQRVARSNPVRATRFQMRICF